MTSRTSYLTFSAQEKNLIMTSAHCLFFILALSWLQFSNVSGAGVSTLIYLCTAGGSSIRAQRSWEENVT